MEAKELRIGNLIELPAFNGTRENVIADLNYHTFTCDVNCIRDAVHYGDDWAGRGIPLTEEWLVRLGFDGAKFEAGKYYEKENHRVYIFKDFFEFEFNSHDNMRFNLFRKYYYVHELQNLYFALTGEELNIKK